MYNNGFRDRKRAFTGMKTVEHIADKNVKIEGYEYYRYTTTVDFAYRIHTEVGHHTVGAIVNNVMVPIDTKLNTGEMES